VLGGCIVLTTAAHVGYVAGMPSRALTLRHIYGDHLAWPLVVGALLIPIQKLSPHTQKMTINKQ
jgi:hypothetical protein